METDTAFKIFLVDDDPFCISLYEQHLLNLGYSNVKTFSNGTDCLNSIIQEPDVIFLDHGMDILDGVEILKKVKRFNPNIFVVFVSGQEDVQVAVNALKYGAFDYIVKGLNEEKRIVEVLHKIKEVKALMEENNSGFLKKIFSSR
jgi:polysaccharide export outer membrane protein